MPPPSTLPSLLCISLLLLLLLPIVLSHQQSPSNAGNTQSTATANQSPPSPPTPLPPRRSAPFFAREFLLAHNKVRMNVTHPLLNWDKKLARYARRWGMKRVADCKMIHSYGPYGENLFWGALDHWTPTEAVESWSREKQFYDVQHNACSGGQMCGHYTQIIWRDSLKLGCTRVKCQTGGVLMICEYDPPGNYVNESPFDTIHGGAAATATANPNAPGTVPTPPSKVSAGSPHRKMAE
ncbi:pathogenesis-related protein 1A [Benincasa hispida]|uniref:pathogenesis-related protein 1A n=1 Tax=Benincasa hispida TaxID=102211 RepID=UPI0018FFF894|nr:pathogenesis-related protein 1A [Benincasa hispida]